MTKQFIEDQINSKQKVLKSEKKRFVYKTIYYLIGEITLLILSIFFDYIVLKATFIVSCGFAFGVAIIIGIYDYKQTKKEILEDIDWYKGLLEEKCKNERLYM